VITSASNPRLRLVRRLASRNQRERLGLFVCEGEDLVEAALAAGLEPVELLVDAERPVPELPPGQAVDPTLLADVSALGHPPRVIGIFRRADLPLLDSRTPPPVGLALWHVADPGNIGTLLRAADGLGPAFVALSSGCADPTGPKALRASAGAVFRVPTAEFDDAPGRRMALVVDGGVPLPELALDDGTTFVLGSEREGLPDEVVAACDERATIPLSPGAESLNVAIAGAIALYEWHRRPPR
jgi:RNA methyltransferase, TrmH family